MSSAHQREYHSIDAYFDLHDPSDVKYEYVNGFLRAINAPTNRHNIVATNVVVNLGIKLKGAPCRVFNSNSLVRINNDGASFVTFQMHPSFAKRTNKANATKRPRLSLSKFSHRQRGVSIWTKRSPTI